MKIEYTKEETQALITKLLPSEYPDREITRFEIDYGQRLIVELYTPETKKEDKEEV